MIRLVYVTAYTLFEAFGDVDDVVLYQRISITFMGYVNCITSVLQLQSIPLYIAGRYRDLNAAWELPLAG